MLKNVLFLTIKKPLNNTGFFCPIAVLFRMAASKAFFVKYLHFLFAGLAELYYFNCTYCSAGEADLYDLPLAIWLTPARIQHPLLR
ncbi:hypothetical protein SAMN02745866_03178 [Alteromonadaceae bacterium Bs31]|nr:hypothetical protein SAMN02745866_03178 [Alteromonadaceae bacterium Bs31]